MTKSSNVVEFRPRRRRIEMPLSLYMFRTMVKQYLNTIADIKEPLQDIYELFQLDDNIWPDQCEYAINQLQILPVQEFCQLLDTSTLLPSVVVPLRYPLLITLNNMNEVVKNLIRLFTEFCTTCKTLSKRAAMQRHMIESSLEKLIQESEALQDRARDLFEQVDQMHFPKHTWASK